MDVTRRDRTMVTNAAPRIVVGIDATPASNTGVQYAALQAQRLGVQLDIVHATPGYSDVHGDIPAMDDGTLSAYGHQLLAEAEAVALSTAPNLSVRTRLLSGGVVDSLVASTEGALRLVLGAERRSLVGRIWTGDIVGGAAARAHCPVVAVAPEWRPSEEHRRIVVGLKSVDDAAWLISAGLDRAQECKAELVVLHGWKLLSGYDDIISNHMARDTYTRRTANLVEPVLEEARQGYPDVSVRVEILHAQPAFALVDASASADLLLLARPRHPGAPHHLGPVTRAVLRESRCPVEILPHQDNGRVEHVLA
jgi:nucleotide-binding universal stress UspA family protein